MAKRIPDALRASIRSLEEAKAWIRTLADAGMSFHFEDSPDTIICGPTDEPLFTKKDAEVIRQRVRELYGFEWGPRAGLGYWYCPIGYLLIVEGEHEVEQAEGYEKGAEVLARAGNIVAIDREHCPTYDYGAPGRYHLFSEAPGAAPHYGGCFDTPDEVYEAIPALGAGR